MNRFQLFSKIMSDPAQAAPLPREQDLLWFGLRSRSREEEGLGAGSLWNCFPEWPREARA